MPPNTVSAVPRSHIRLPCGDTLVVASDDSRTHHERYGVVYGLMKDRDKELAHAFDDSRRSVALFQLAMIRRQGLLADAEMYRFTPETREWVQKMLSL